MDWQWRAWVGRPGGGKLGAAFLVTGNRLLTCAHTVHGMDEARIGFPWSCGTWSGCGPTRSAATRPITGGGC